MKQLKRKGSKPIIQQQEKNGVEYLTFPLLSSCGVGKHLFSTRIGGVSKECYGTMNLSTNGEEEMEVILENYHRIAQILGEPLDHFVKSKQTHTANVKCVTWADAGVGLTKPLTYTDIDGLITREKGLVLTTTYADCVPLFFLDPVQEAIGLSHSGWRGTVAKIGRETISAMERAFGSRPEDILCAIGPSICRDCYEVSEEVIVEFEQALPDWRKQVIPGEELYVEKGNGKYQLDLWTANRLVLLEAGVNREHIQTTDVCTCCNADYLHSHRASGGKRGLLGAFFAL